MSSKTLEKLITLNMSIALIFGMIIEGKVGFIGFTIFFIITAILLCINHKRSGSTLRGYLVETVYAIILVAIAFIFGYLSAFKPGSKMIDVFLIVSPIWIFGGLIILAIRARKKRRK